jgi:hypothetical protein
MAPGAVTRVNNEGQEEIYTNPTDIFTGTDSFPLKQGTIDLSQVLPRCGKEGTHWTATVSPLESLPAPKVPHELCQGHCH